MSSPKWFTSPRLDPGAPLRVFCFPYAGAGASVFRTWWRDLPARVELCALQLPGREARFGEPSFTSLSPLVAAVSDAITPWLDRPFVFLGHSMGSLIAFELARTLARRGGPQPRALLLSGRRAPGAPHPVREMPLHTLSDDDLQEELVRMNGMDPGLLANADLMSLLLPILRADFSVCETHVHQPGPRLACPIVALGGDHDHTVAPAQLDGWAEQTSGTFRRALFPGAHFYFKHVWKDFARTLSAELEPHIPATTTTLRVGA